MAGHSKWANIKRKKEANDKVRGALFAKVSRAITIAVIESGGQTDPEHNVRLRLAVENARAVNMAKDTIQRAIEKGAGGEGANLKEVRYEGFAPGGVSILVVAATDNPNRTMPLIRHAFESNGGKLGSPGAVAYLFEQCAQAIFSTSTHTMEDVFKLAESMNALDIEAEDEYITVYFPFSLLGTIKADEVSIYYRPLSTVTVSPEIKTQVEQLIEALETLDDVQHVFANYA